jgi:Tn3 transposase DDE domain
MLQRRIELCGDAPRAPMQPCKRRVRPPPGSPPAQGRSPPEQAQSEKSQGVRGTESPDSSVNTKETENYVSVFAGELHQNVLTRALQEYERLNKTIFILRYLLDEPFQRRIGAQINKGEALHALRGFLFVANEGKIRRPL